MTYLDTAMAQLKDLKKALYSCSTIAIHSDIDAICKVAIESLIENLPHHHKSKEELDQAIDELYSD